MTTLKYFGKFNGQDEILKEYEAPKDALDNAILHLAWYGYGSYDGQSLVIFEKDGKLYEVNGCHCSCQGLEGQWLPEETSWEALAIRKVDDNYTDGSKEADEALKRLCKKMLKRERSEA